MSFDPIHLWNTMTPIAKGVVVLLIIMSIYSLTVAFERFLYYRKARNQSVAYAKMVTGVPEAGQAPGGDRRLEEVQEQPRRPRRSRPACYEFAHDLKSGGVGHQGPRHDRGRRARHRARGPRSRPPT